MHWSPDRLPSRGRASIRCVGWAALALLMGAPATAQVVTGRVRDEATRAAVPGVIVQLHNEYHVLVGRSLTDSIGRFAMRAPKSGKYYYRAERIGYATTITPSWTIGDEEELSVELLIAAKAVPMLPLIVVGARRTNSAALMGFEHRLELAGNTGLGRIFGPKQLEEYRGLPIQHLLAGIPSLTIQSEQGRITVSSRRGMISMGGGNCVMAIYIDGLRSVDGAERLAEINLDDVHGVEVYRGASEIPGEFGGPTAGCGVLAIWTKRGG